MTVDEEALDRAFTALGDPVRRALVARLSRGEATVNELAEPFGVSQQAISKHLAYLERASLIEKRKEGREQFCSLRAEPLKQAYDWMDDYRQFWDGAFDRLDVLLKRLQQPQRQQRKRNARKSR